MAEDDEDFAAMFAASERDKPRQRRPKVGDMVKGSIITIGKDAVFVDLGGKAEGQLDRAQVSDNEGTLLVKVGDGIEARVVSDAGGVLSLRTKLGRGPEARAELAQAHELGIPVEGLVTEVVKGGVSVDVAGVRGFCPASQIDNRFVEDLASFVGQRLTFKITRYEPRNLVLSRRVLVEEAQEKLAGETRKRLTPGAVLRGKVVGFKPFGAFVDLGGIEGLIPLRELSHDRVQRAEDVVAIGDVVEVQVMRLEREGERLKITLSLKALESDPWQGIDAIAPVGRVVAGQVTRLTDFGAFVRLAPGVEGLLHVSELGARVKGPAEVLEVGQQLLVVVRSVDPARRRISLALSEEGAKPGDAAKDLRPVLNAVVSATVEKHERFGVFVQIAGTQGRAGRGLVPNAELGLRPGADVRKELPIGAEVRAKVIDATEGRLRLSVRAAREDAERAEFDSYRSSQASKGGMGTLGDLLRKKLGG